MTLSNSNGPDQRDEKLTLPPQILRGHFVCILDNEPLIAEVCQSMIERVGGTAIVRVVGQNDQLPLLIDEVISTFNRSEASHLTLLTDRKYENGFFGDDLAVPVKQALPKIQVVGMTGCSEHNLHSVPEIAAVVAKPFKFNHLMATLAAVHA